MSKRAKKAISQRLVATTTAGLGALLSGLLIAPSMAQENPWAEAQGANAQVSIWGNAPINLYRDKKYVSKSGKHYLIHQNDGNLVIYTADGRYVWGIERYTDQLAEANFVEVGLGNIVVIGSAKGWIWAALPRWSDAVETSAQLNLDEDGVLRIRSAAPGNPVLWASDGRTGLVTPSSAPPPRASVTAPSAHPPRASVTAPSAPPPRASVTAPSAPPPRASVTAPSAPPPRASVTAPSAPPPRASVTAPSAPPAPAPAAVTPAVTHPTTPSAPPASAAMPAASAAAPVAAHPAGMTDAAHKAAIQPSMDVATAFPIRPGQTIEPGTKYVSPDGIYYMIQGSDGNLMVKMVMGDRYLWGLDRQGVTPSKVKLIRMAPDGNLIAIDAEGNVLWSPVGSDVASGSYLTLSQGNLSVISPASAITWSSAEPKAPIPSGQKVDLPPVPSRCVPKAGFAKCRVIASPRITIHGTARTTDSAMDFVEMIYTDMTSKLKPAFPKSKLNFVEILITNDESAAELAKLPGIGDNGRPATGDASNAWLLGGGGPNTTWITEQMMCKTGVKTRGARDTETRTYDQIVHEFAHTMSFRFDYLPTINRVFAGSVVPAEEAFPYAVQAWFDPSQKYSVFRTPAFDAEIAKIFTSRGSYDCANYKG